MVREHWGKVKKSHYCSEDYPLEQRDLDKEGDTSNEVENKVECGQEGPNGEGDRQREGGENK